MRFVQPIPLLYANNHNHIGNPLSSHNSPATDNHNHHQIWNHPRSCLPNATTTSLEHVTTSEQHKYERSNHTQEWPSTDATTQDHISVDNTVNTVCITSGGAAVSFRKYTPVGGDSRRSSNVILAPTTGTTSSQSFVANPPVNDINVDGDGNQIGEKDNNSNSLNLSVWTYDICEMFGFI